MQEYQPAAQITARHNIFPQMAPYMSWIFLVLVGIDPGVYHLWSKIVSHNTTDARQSHSTPIFTSIPHSSVHGPLIFLLYTNVWTVRIFGGFIFQCNLSFRTMQVDWLGVRGAQIMYVLGTLKNHGFEWSPLWEVTRATFITNDTEISSLLYIQPKIRKIIKVCIYDRGFEGHPSRSSELFQFFWDPWPQKC